MKVALGVSGGIACYKSAEILRRLQDRGLEVVVLMTKGATQFVTPLTFRALSGNKVYVDIFEGARSGADFEGAFDHILEPEVGQMACRTYGPGRLAPVEEIVEVVICMLNRRRDLEGRKILVTAGPTVEDIDPVRYISNRSSGKMGYALAQAARERGGQVT